MNDKHYQLQLKLSVLTVLFLTACSSYSPEDYGHPSATNNKTSCINMEPAQEQDCKEREDSLLIGLGADENCNHPYEYERNRCLAEQAKQKKTLADSLKKHTGK